jgi:hypothetical protein
MRLFFQFISFPAFAGYVALSLFLWQTENAGEHRQWGLPNIPNFPLENANPFVSGVFDEVEEKTKPH